MHTCMVVGVCNLYTVLFFLVGTKYVRTCVMDRLSVGFFGTLVRDMGYDPESFDAGELR